MRDGVDYEPTETIARQDARLVRIQNTVFEKPIRKALGAELRHAREAKGWSRAQFVARLPSGIGERTLLSYEHGTRAFTVPRLIELSAGFGVGAPLLLGRALQQTHIYMDILPLRVDLRALLDDKGSAFRSMAQWARNKFNECPEGIVEVAPVVVRELATFIGCAHLDLANYLARFIPDEPVRMIETETTG